MKFIIALAIAAVAAQDDEEEMTPEEFMAEIESLFMNSSPNSVFGTCTLPEDHEYGTLSAGSCEAGSGIFAGQDIYCCYSYITEDPWGTIGDYDTTIDGVQSDTHQNYSCESPSFWLGMGSKAGEEANTSTIMAAVPLKDGTAPEVLHTLDCNNAAAVAGASLALAAYMLY